MSEEKGAFPFSGEYACGLDEKGRFSVPLPIRNVLEYRDTLQGPFQIMGGLFSGIPALRVLDKSSLKNSYLAGEREFLNGRAIQLDKQQRITLPSNARVYAGLEKQLIIAGIVDSLYLFSPANHQILKTGEQEFLADFERAMRGI